VASHVFGPSTTQVDPDLPDRESRQTTNWHHTEHPSSFQKISWFEKFEFWRFWPPITQNALSPNFRFRRAGRPGTSAAIGWIPGLQIPQFWISGLRKEIRDYNHLVHFESF